MPIHQAVTNGVAVLNINHPPVNALSVSAGIVEALGNAVVAAQADAAVSAIVIAGEGRLFSGGADITDFDRDLANLDSVRQLFNRCCQDN